MKLKRKRLNNKGFTLIELLAVVVILALLMSISVTSVLNAMNNSRVSSIHSQAKAVAEWYNNTVAQDELGIDTKVIPNAVVNVINDGNWHCLDDISYTDAGGTTQTFDLAAKYNLSKNDFVLKNSSPAGTAPTAASPTVATNTCSAIHVDTNGRVEILLVASQEGKFNVGKYQFTYGLSSSDTGCKGAANDCA